MADLEKKLARFSKKIINEAEKNKEEIIAELEENKKLAVREKEIEILTDAYEDIQKAIAKYSKENNERVLKLEMELKKEVIKKREHIIEQVFDKVKSRIDEFIASDEYKTWLVNSAKKCVAEVGNGEIYVTAQDLKYKADILAALPESTVSEADTDIIGGVIVKNKNVSADYSIREMLYEEHRNFLKTSGLSIKA